MCAVFLIYRSYQQWHTKYNIYFLTLLLVCNETDMGLVYSMIVHPLRFSQESKFKDNFPKSHIFVIVRQ